MKNLVTIQLTLTEQGLNKFLKVPTFKNLLYSNQLTSLMVGDNILNVNHTVWGSLQRITQYDSENMSVTQI